MAARFLSPPSAVKRDTYMSSPFRLCHLCEGAVHTVILHVVPGRRAGSKASDYLGIEGDADRDRRLQTTSGSSRQRREIREAGHRGAGLLETRDDTALQDGEILR
jgi:hypothetical protein